MDNLFPFFVLLLSISGAGSTGVSPEKHNDLEDINPEAMSFGVLPQIELRVNTSLVEASGQWVKVEWCCSLGFNAGDYWLALYAPAEADPTKVRPVKIWKGGFQFGFLWLLSGSKSVQVFNHRTSTVKFVLIRNQKIVLGESKEIEVANVNEPVQGHLALTGNDREMLIQWTTKDAGSPIVVWGEESNNYPYQADGDSRTYEKEELCGPPATAEGWLAPGMLHSALMTNLEPGKRYFYKYGDKECGFSKEHSFYGPPLKGSSETVKFIVYGDLGTVEDHYAIGSAMTDELIYKEYGDAQLIIHNGDVGYSRGHVAIWDLFMESITPIATRAPYMTTVGNHDRDWPGTNDRFHNISRDSGGECGIPYRRRFKMPVEDERQYWFSYDFGPVHFLHYDTEDDFKPGSEQFEFIERDLRNVDRKKTPWVIALGHRPMYVGSPYTSPFVGDIDVARDLQAAFEELFFDIGVDLVLQGHHHGYHRTCPLYKKECMAQGKAPVYFVIGNAGARLTPVPRILIPDIYKVVEYVYGFGVFSANSTHLSMQAVRSHDGSVLETMHFERPSLPKPQ